MALESISIHRAELDSHVSKTEIALEQQMEALEAAVWKYNNAADQLKLIPVDAKRASGVKFEISVNRNAQAPHELLDVDLKVSRHGCFHHMVHTWSEAVC